MGSSYYITYGGNRLTFPGATGSVAWEYVPPPFRRYEYTIFGDSSGLPVSAGSVSMPFSAFDNIGIRAVWKDTRNQHGNGWYTWYDNSMFSATSGTVAVPLMLGNTSYYYDFMTKLNYNNTAKTFTTVQENGTNRWTIVSPIASTAGWSTQNNGARHIIIGQIIGVKYQ